MMPDSTELNESIDYDLNDLNMGLRSLRYIVGSSIVYNLGGLVALSIYLSLVFGIGYFFQYADVIVLVVFLGFLFSFFIFRLYIRPVIHFFKQKDLSSKIPINDELRRLLLNFPVIFSCIDLIVWCVIGLYITHWFIAINPEDIKYLQIHLGLSLFFAAQLVALFGFYTNERLIAKYMLPVLMKERRVSDITNVIPVPIFVRLIILIFTSALWPSLFLYMVFSIGDAKGNVLLFALALIAVNGIWQGLHILGAISWPIGILAGRFERLQKGEEEKSPQGFWRADALGRFFEMFNDLLRTMEDRDFIRSTFSRYLNQEVVNEILKGDVELGGEKRDATVMFADIRGFTSLSEQMTPEETVEFLNEYFESMVQSIIDFRGVPDKFLGDGIMAVWGVPVEQDNHSFLAVEAALDMLEGLKAFNEKRKYLNGKDLRIGIGLHCGELIAGNIGSRKKMEFTVIGDTVNTCSRIEGKCKDFGSLLNISEDVYIKLPAEVQKLFVLQGQVHLRGKSRELKLYVLKEGLIPPPA